MILLVNILHLNVKLLEMKMSITCLGSGRGISRSQTAMCMFLNGFGITTVLSITMKHAPLWVFCVFNFSFHFQHMWKEIKCEMLRCNIVGFSYILCMFCKKTPWRWLGKCAKHKQIYCFPVVNMCCHSCSWILGVLLYISQNNWSSILK